MTTATMEPISTLLVAFPSALPALVILLKITGLLLAALAITVTLQRAAAGIRHLVWLVTLAGLLLLPALALWSPLPIAILPAAAAPASEIVADATPFAATPVVPQPTTATRTIDLSAGTPAAFRMPSVGTSLALLWALGAAVLLGRLAFGAWSVRRIVRRARRLDQPEWQTPLYEIADRLGLEAAPVLLQSADVRMPFAAGLLHASIVLPTESESWSPERRSAVLVHELGHVRRRDLIGHTLSRLACALYWFHPLVWTAARQLRAESERACDDLALAFGARPSDYAEHLLDIVTCVRDHRTPAVALALAHRKEFEGRMLAILNPELPRREPHRWQTASLAGALTLGAILLGAAAPVPRPAVASRSPSMQASPTADSLPSDTSRRQLALPMPPTSPVAAVERTNPTPVARPVPSLAPQSPPDPRPAPAPLASSAAPGRDASAANDDERAAVLARALKTDANAEVRRVAAWGLQRYARVDVALDALISAVNGDTDHAVREMAAWALASARRSSAAAGALADAIRKDKDNGVRATAVWAAGSIGDAAAVDALASALGDTDPEVRANAAWAIGSCHPDRAPAPLVRALTDGNEAVRLSVAWALYALRDQATADAIDAALRKESNDEVQRGLIRALGAMGDEAIPALQRLVTSPDSAVRTVAITALAGGGAGGPWPWPRPEPRPFP